MNTRMQLQWRKSVQDTWCGFESVVLPDAPASGIVVIWSGSTENVIYIARGGIAKSLRWARQFKPIASHTDLFVTWATVPEDSQNGVWNYLSERLSPLHREPAVPDAPIAVNLPWEQA